MVKIISPAQATSNDGTNKQRKKQAKREAKTMLKLEQAKKDVQKAEQKVAKAQAQLEADRTRLRNLEEELTNIRTPEQQAAPAPYTPTASLQETSSDVAAPQATDQAASDGAESSAGEEHHEETPAS